MTEVVETEEQLRAFVAAHPAAILYFSGDGCAVCEALFPKVERLLTEEFPRAALARIHCGNTPDVAAQQRVFTVPVMVLYVDGREAQRFVRHISLGQLREALARPYQLLFG